MHTYNWDSSGFDLNCAFTLIQKCSKFNFCILYDLLSILPGLYLVVARFYWMKLIVLSALHSAWLMHAVVEQRYPIHGIQL